jgi:hypothetical protein
MTRKRTPPEGKRWKKGESGNPAGRPPDQNRIGYWLKEWGGMTSEQAAKLCKLYSAELRKADTGELPLASILALRVWMSLMNEPTPGLFAEVMDRLEGKVTQTVDQKNSGDMTIKVVYVKRDHSGTGGAA